MRAHLVTAAAALTLAAAMPASAVTTIFFAGLSSTGEPVPTSTATGAAIVSFDDVADTVTVMYQRSGYNTIDCRRRLI